MYAITGITGKVGGELARRLLAAGRPVRAVLRDAAKAQAWRNRGCEVALADMADAAALTQAFTGAEAVFLLPPPVFDPQPGYPEVRAVIAALRAALSATRPARVVSLSTIGADAPHDNLLSQHTLMEEALGELDLPITFLRPAWFMENALWDVASARDAGLLHSFLQPAERTIPMVATADVGALAAQLMQQTWTGSRIVELEGPAQVSPDDLAAAFARALGRPVEVEIVPRDAWEALFRAQGMRHPLPRMRMLDGFNAGWIAFRGDGAAAIKGTTSLQAVVSTLVAEAAAG